MINAANKKKMKWWAYIICGIVLILFLVPAMISAKDDFAVIGGIVLLIIFGVVSWHFWISKCIQSIKAKFNEK